jgi:hypothetical protein
MPPMPGAHGAAPANPMAAMHGSGGATPGQAGTAPAVTTDTVKAKRFSDLKQFIPASMTRLVGFRAADLVAGKSDLGDSLLRTLAPVLQVATRVGVPEADVDLVMAGGNPKNRSVMVLVRSKSPLKSAEIVKSAGADEKGEKIGKATLHTLPKKEAHENAIAFVDGDVLLLGRKDIVTEALKNPVEGPARSGVESITVDGTLFFVAGDSLGKQTFDATAGLRSLAALTDAKTSQLKGMALGLTGAAGGATTGGGTSPGVMPAGMGASSDPAAAMHGAHGSSGPPAASAAAAATPAAGMHSAHGMQGATPAAATGTTAAPATIALNKDLTGNVTVVLGAAFATETSAKVAEDKINSARKKLRDLETLLNNLLNQASSQTGSGATPPGMGATPAAGHAGPSGPATPQFTPRSVGPVGEVRHELESRRELFSQEVLETLGLVEPVESTTGEIATFRCDRDESGSARSGNVFAQQSSSPPAGGHGDGSGSAGATPPGMGAPGMTSAGGNAPRRFSNPWMTFELGFAVSRAKDKLQLTHSVESRVFQDNLGRLADVLGSAGATAVDDGLYAGTLSALHSPTTTWLADAAKAENHKGVRRVGELPLRAGYSWMCELLPYVGREDLYLKLDFTKTWREGENYPLTHSVIPQFLNPADPRAQLRGLPYDGMGATHFAGMSGVEDGRNVVAATLPRSDPRAGIFGYDDIAKPEAITDGQSNTIQLIGSGRVIGGWVIGGGATIRGARTPHFDPITGFGSEGLPSGGVYVLMADGSTRVINGDIDEAVFKGMCTIQGAESVDKPGTQASAK